MEKITKETFDKRIKEFENVKSEDRLEAYGKIMHRLSGLAIMVQQWYHFVGSPEFAGEFTKEQLGNMLNMLTDSLLILMRGMRSVMDYEQVKRGFLELEKFDLKRKPRPELYGAGPYDLSLGEES